MLHVKTIVGTSPIAGIGLFTDQDIFKGTIVWLFQKGFDLKLDPKAISNFPEVAQDYLSTYAYASKQSGLLICPMDNGRFLNHSTNPNLDVIFKDGVAEDINIANRDIKKGQELTIDYQMFDSEFSLYDRNLGS